MVTAGIGTGTAASAASTRSTPDRGPDRRALQQALDEITKNGAASALAEIRDPAWVWRGAAGRAELGTSRPVPAHGRFRIGSVTKTFTATVMLQLEAERRLRLDDPLARWLPGAVPGANEITLRNLLQHTSGVPEYMERFYELYPTTADVVRQRFRRWTPGELLALVEGRPPLFEPGTSWSYANTNYTLLSLVIKRVTGNDYATEVSRRILRPLGLRHTELPGNNPLIPGPHAHAYLPADETGEPVDVSVFNPSIAGAAGEIVSTTADINRFLGALLGGRLLPPAQLARMKTTAPGNTDYGLGLLQLQLPGTKLLWGHTGSIFGYLTLALGTQDGRRRIAMSINPWGDGDFYDALVHLLSIAFPDPLATRAAAPTPAPTSWQHLYRAGF
ncbi:MAG TPA: serine hydrolase domain-containing protein [Candidatus Limnocylindrales bacterium]